MATGLQIGNSYNFPRPPMELIYKLASDMDFNIEQVNGQRTFGPSYSWTGPPPLKSCEIFIGNIPRYLFENTLVPLFASIGPLYQFRLMMDFGGQNRGFAFAMYTQPSHAQTAIAKLHNFEIRRNKKLAVMVCQDNNSLYMGGICRSPAHIIRTIYKHTVGVVEVTVSHEDAKKRRYVYIDFSDHSSAAMARRYYMEHNYTIWESKIKVIVDWKHRHNLPQPVNVIGSIDMETGELDIKYASLRKEN